MSGRRRRDSGGRSSSAGYDGTACLVTSATPNLIVRSVPAEQVGIATGMNANIRTIGGALGTTMFAAIIGATATNSGLPTEAGFVTAFTVGGVLAILGAVPGIVMAERGRATKATSL